MHGLLKCTATLALVVAAAGPAWGQASQTVNVPVSSTSGWYQYGCTSTDVYSCYNYQSCKMSWTDTVNTNYVRIQVTVNLTYHELSGGYSLALNGVNLPAATQPSTYLGCEVVPTAVVTSYATVTGYVAGGSNTLEIYENGDCLVLDNNSSGWAVQIVVTDLNLPPTVANVQQVETATGLPLVTGAQLSTTSVDFTGDVSDPNLTDPLGTDLTWDVEVKPVGQNFDGNGLLTVTVPNGSPASVSQAGLAIGQYHWRYRVTDTRGATTGWVSYGLNPETAADFEVIPPPPPPGPPDSIDHGGGDGLFGDKLTCGASGHAGHGAVVLFAVLAAAACGTRILR